MRVTRFDRFLNIRRGNTELPSAHGDTVFYRVFRFYAAFVIVPVIRKQKLRRQIVHFYGESYVRRNVFKRIHAVFADNFRRSVKHFDYVGSVFRRDCKLHRRAVVYRFLTISRNRKAFALRYFCGIGVKFHIFYGDFKCARYVFHGVFSVFFSKTVAVAFYNRRAIRIRFVQRESKRIISAVFRLRRAVERVSIARRKRYVILSDIQAFHGDFNRTRYVFYHIRFSVRRRGKLATVGFHFKVGGIVAFLYFQRKSISFAVNRFRVARKRKRHAFGGCGYGILIFLRALHRDFQSRFHVFHGVFAVFFRYRFAVDFHDKRALIVTRGFRYGKRIIFAVNSLCRTGYFVAFARGNRYGIRFLFNAAHGDIQIGRYVFHRVFAVRFRKQSIVGFHRKRGSFVSFACNFKRESIIFAAVHGIGAVQFVPLARAERYPVHRIRNRRGIIGNGFVVLRFHFHRIRIHRRKRVERERFLRFQIVAVHVYHIRRCFRNGLPRYGKIVVQYDFRRGERFRFFPIGIVVARGKAGCR